MEAYLRMTEKNSVNYEYSPENWLYSIWAKDENLNKSRKNAFNLEPTRDSGEFFFESRIFRSKREVWQPYERVSRPSLKFENKFN
jgi:hypothetical protein